MARAEVDEGIGAWQGRAMMAAQTARRPDHVLLVEDSPIIAMNTEELLRELGVRDVRVAASVAQAQALLDEARFDMALLDLKLGDETSLPIALRLAEDGVPIIFVTGFGEEIDLPESLCGTRVLKKPYNFNDLDEIIALP